MSTISSSTTSTTAYKVTADTTGTLVFQTGATPTTAMTLGTDQSVTFAGTQTYTGAATFTSGITVQGLTVGKGAGAVATNTAVGASALAGSNSGTGVNTAVGNSALLTNSTGYYNTAIGAKHPANYFSALESNTTGNSNIAVGTAALGTNTTGSSNTAIGFASLPLNTTASNNTAVGYQALYSNTVANNSVAIGHQAGYSYVGTSGGNNVLVGQAAGYALTTGSGNTFIGSSITTAGSGAAITTGTKNTIIGGYSGNQGGLDIRTASNYIVLSDGDGNVRLASDGSGNIGVGSPPITSYAMYLKTSIGGGFLHYKGADFVWATVAPGTVSTTFSTAYACSWVSKDAGTSRSINAGGTVNTNGSDYAEYMTKAGNFVIAKGDVVGINVEGKLTNLFAEAISFAVKSTDPSFVGGDNWFEEEAPKAEDGTMQLEGEAWDAYKVREEEARATVDRIAFAGQVPVNVTGATAGQYIIPVNDNGAIKGEAVSNPTFEQYQIAVGKVIAIESDGRAKIIVKVA